MGLESASFISELVATNPVGAVDDYATADDHLRLIKSVLQSQFPNFTALAVNPTSVEFNLLVGLLASSAELNILDGALLSTTELNTLNGIIASTAELNKLNGVTSLTADLNLLSGAAAGGLTAAELLFVNDVTSAIQAQINGKAASAHSHTSGEISALDTGDVTTGQWANARVSAGNVTQHVAAIDHDLLLNFLASKHIDHSLVSVLAGNDMSGGGTISATRTLDVSIASTSQRGTTRTATQAEVDAGTDPLKYVTPATLEAKSSSLLGAVKTADTPKTTDIVQADDPHLSVEVVSGRSYRVELWLVIEVTGGSTPDFTYSWTFPASSTGHYRYNEVDEAGSTLEKDLILAWHTTSQQIDLTQNTDSGIHMVGTITADSSGTFALRWAQDVSSGNTITLKKDSHMLLTPLN
ncbi:MAG: hypothetical protein O7D34_05320 [Ignavibacteria bacterium]|nr:hypothetical protein [Ignavibacteria bacterium]